MEKIYKLNLPEDVVNEIKAKTGGDDLDVSKALRNFIILGLVALDTPIYRRDEEGNYQEIVMNGTVL